MIMRGAATRSMYGVTNFCSVDMVRRARGAASMRRRPPVFATLRHHRVAKNVLYTHRSNYLHTLPQADAIALSGTMSC